jgi:hypothetical protein
MKIIFNFCHLGSRKYPHVYGISETDLSGIDVSALEFIKEAVRVHLPDVPLYHLLTLYAPQKGMAPR